MSSRCFSKIRHEVAVEQTHKQLVRHFVHERRNFDCGWEKWLTSTKSVESFKRKQSNKSDTFANLRRYKVQDNYTAKDLRNVDSSELIRAISTCERTCETNENVLVGRIHEMTLTISKICGNSLCMLLLIQTHKRKNKRVSIFAGRICATIFMRASRIWALTSRITFDLCEKQKWQESMC